MTAAQVLIVGSSLAGLRAAEALRRNGYDGPLTLVGDETHPPYDRPALSKQVALGIIEADATTLPRLRHVDARWRAGLSATHLDLAGRAVCLADGSREPFDRLLIATGARARPWHRADEATLDGVLTVRTREDAVALHAALAARPSRAVVVGGGFNGSEIASACRKLDVPVTLVEGSETPLAGALGATVGAAAAALQRAHGVDLRCGCTVDHLESDARGRVRRVHLADGTALDADLVVVALGSLPNVEWLHGAGLAVGPHGVACDPACRAYDRSGIAMDGVFVAGDVARFPHPLFGFEFVTLEHWGNAVAMAEVAAHNMLAAPGNLRPHAGVPAFWSSQFDVSIKSVGVPALADQVVIAQGSLERREFVALYGQQDRLVAAVAFDHGKWLPHYEALIAAKASFPNHRGMDAPACEISPASFPSRRTRGLHTPTTLSGHLPSEPSTTALTHPDEEQRR